MTIIQRKQQRPSKKITYLLKECQNEMNEMKCELFDLQTALNACRTSLKNLHLSPTSSAFYSRDLSLDYRTIDFVPCLNSTVKKVKKIRAKKIRHTHKTKTKTTDSESIYTSSSSSLVESSTYTYPSTSSYNISENYPINFKSVKLNKNNRNIGYQIVSKKTTTTTTTDEYSTKFNTCKNCRNSKFKNLGFNLTPVKCNEYSYKSRKRQKYDFNTIFYPYKTMPAKKAELNCLNSNTLSTISSHTRSSDKFCISKSGSLKDQFLVINHKNDLSDNQTIFEPKASSTPIKVYQKTSTPKVVDNSYFENILIDLEANSKKLANLLKSKDSNKISDYFSSSTQIEDNEYDVPGPRTCQNHDYQSPNLLKKNNTLVEEKKYLIDLDEDKGFISTPVNNANLFSDLLNNESENLTKISTLESNKNLKDKESLIYSETQSFKNLSLVSTASSVRSTVIKCCIKPFRLLYNSKNLKKKF